MSFFSQKPLWLKGNIHSHTTRSDGTCDPVLQIQNYNEAGYDFLSITDHNVVDSHQLEHGTSMCVLPGWERDIRYKQDNTKNIHLVGLCSACAQQQPVMSEPPGDPEILSQQQLVHDMKALNQFVVLAHPIWSRLEAWEVSDLQDFDAIEVYNNGTECLCHAGLNDVYWDMLLRQGRHVLGIACDDTHHKTAIDDRFGGWIMVNCQEKNHTEIMENIRAGNFYATQGPSIYDWGIRDHTLYFHCSPVEEIFVITYPKRGKTYAVDCQKDGHIEFELSGYESYVRIECRDANGKTAWTNAHFFQ